MRRIITVFFLSLMAFSCGPKKAKSLESSVPSHVVLGAFSDIKNPSTINLSELQDLPKRVDLSNEMTSVKDQSNRGACSFFTAISLIEAAIKKVLKREVNLSEEFLIYEAKSLGHSPLIESSNVLANLDVAQKTGLLFEKDAPYSPSWFEEGMPCAHEKSAPGEGAPFSCFSHESPREDVLKRVIRADQFKIISIDSSSTNSLLKFLANERRPISITFLVHKAGWEQSGQIIYNEDFRNECLKDQSLCGTHSVNLTGYDLDKKVFFFKNSWGEEWGNKGYGTVNFETVDLYTEKKYYSVMVNENFSLPEEKKMKWPKITNFKVSFQREENQPLRVKIFGSVNNVSGHFLYATSLLVKQIKDLLKAPNDQSTELIGLSKENALKFKRIAVRSSYVLAFNEAEFDEVSWTVDSPLTLAISENLFQLPEVQAELNAKGAKVFIRTTLYDFTDGGLKTLQRLYRPL